MSASAMLPLRLPTVVPVYLRDPFLVSSCSASISRRYRSSASQHSMSLQQYDTQLYIACSVNDAASPLSTLESCLASLHCWFCHNGLALNPSKTEAIIFGTRQRLNFFRDHLAFILSVLRYLSLITLLP